MAKKECLHFVVEGFVQGVWFRSATRKKAEQLNITGWVRNMENGDVEVLACGYSNDLENFKDWLCEGPKLAHVISVDMKKMPLEKHKDFEVRY